MSKKIIKKENLERIIVFSCIFIFVGILIAYNLFGHQIVKEKYERKEFYSLKDLGPYEKPLPLVEYYFNKADSIFYEKYLMFLYNFIFFLLVYGIYKKNKKTIYKIAYYIRYPTEPYESRKVFFRNDLFFACLLYFIITYIYFYRVIKYIPTAFIIPDFISDHFASNFGLWYGFNALKTDIKKLGFTNLIFYPEGSKLFSTDLSLYNIFAGFILNLFTKNILLIQNLLILHSFIISGVGGFMLVRYLTKNSYLGLLGGFLFSFNPSHVEYSMLHISTLSIQFIPFFILYVIKMIKENKKIYLFLSSLFFLLNTISSYYYFIFSVYFLFLSYIYLAFKHKKIILWDYLYKIIVIVGITLALFSVWWINAFIVFLKNRFIEILWSHEACVSDLLGFFLPHQFHILEKISPIPTIAKNRGYAVEINCYLGIVNIILVSFALKELTKKYTKYLLGFLFFLILSMGVYLKALGINTNLILPYFFIKFLPFFSMARAPIRAIAYAYCLWAIITVLALRYLYRRLYLKKIKKILLLIILTFLIFFDYYSIIEKTVTLKLPEAYKMIKKGDFGIMNLPLVNPIIQGIFMYYQTFHQMPIVEGHLSRKTNKTLIDYLELKDLEKQKQQLTKNKVKYIVIHKDLIEKGYKLRWHSLEDYRNNYNLLYEDERSILLEVY